MRHRTFPKPAPRLVVRRDRDRAIDRTWAAVCRTVDARDKYRCRCCGRPTVKTLTLCAERAEHHHVTPRSIAPQLRSDPRNVLLLCQQDHGRVTRHELRIVGAPDQYFEFNGRAFLDASCALVFLPT